MNAIPVSLHRLLIVSILIEAANQIKKYKFECRKVLRFITGLLVFELTRTGLRPMNSSDQSNGLA